MNNTSDPTTYISWVTEAYSMLLRKGNVTDLRYLLHARWGTRGHTRFERDT